MALNGRIGSWQIIGVNQPRPGVDVRGEQLAQRVAHHAGPMVVEHRLAGLHIPFPGSGLGAVNGAVQSQALLGQFQFFELAVVNVLEGAVHPHAKALLHFGHANAAHPFVLALAGLDEHFHIPRLAMLAGGGHHTAGQGSGFTIREMGQHGTALGHKLLIHPKNLTGDARPAHLVALHLVFPGANAGRLVRQFQRTLGFGQRLLCELAGGDVGADGHVALHRPSISRKWGNEGVYPVQPPVFGAVAHLALPRLAAFHGLPHVRPKGLVVEAGIDDGVGGAQQLLAAVAADGHECIVHIGDEAIRIGLRHDGMDVDGVHERRAFAQGRAHAGQRVAALGHVLLNGHKTGEFTRIVGQRLNGQLHPIRVPGFGLIEDFHLNALPLAQGLTHGLNGGRVGLRCLQQSAGFVAQGLVQGVPGGLCERLVHPGNEALGVGHHHQVGGVAGHHGQPVVFCRKHFRTRLGLAAPANQDPHPIAHRQRERRSCQTQCVHPIPVGLGLELGQRAGGQVEVAVAPKKLLFVPNGALLEWDDCCF